MDAWRLSQEPKVTVTTRTKNGEPDTVTTRTEKGPGKASFLNTALRAIKQLRQITDAAPAAPPKASAAAQVALKQMLTPEQFQTLTPAQIEGFSEAHRRIKRAVKDLDALSKANAQAEPASPEPTPRAEAESPAEQAVTAAEKNDADLTAAIEEDLAISRNGHQPVSKKSPPEPRHPEWPAETFLSRSWLPPDANLAGNSRENGVHTVDAEHERNGCACHASAARPVGTIDSSPAVHCWDANELRKHKSRRDG
jgi:hypothetical protein